MPPPANFRKDLPFGKRAEQVFLDAYSPFIESNNNNDSRSPDFRIIGSGDLLELKSDRYPPKRFFFERWSVEETKQPGGPWRAREEGVRYLAYWFTSTGEWFLFEVDALVERLESLPLAKYQKSVPNRGYCTVGYAVPIELVADLAERHELAFSKE